MNSTTTQFIFTPSTISYPIYHFSRPEIFPGISDKYVSVIAPIFVYWIVSLFFHLIDNLNWELFEKYRIHESEEAKSKNRVTMKQVIMAVLFQQIIQTVLAVVWLEDDPVFMGPFRDHASDLKWYAGWMEGILVASLGKETAVPLLRKYGSQSVEWIYWWGIPSFQLLWAAFVMDTWQYFLHRYFHTNTFLYRHVHSWHHRLYVPYAFGALYNHPLEGFIFDTLGAMVAHSCAMLTMRQGILFFAISTAKTVDDHCGFAFPWDPLQHMFGNNADYHDIHHQIAGLKKNFSQPYFIHYDYFLGTRLTRKDFSEAKAQRLAKRNAQKSSPDSSDTLDVVGLKTE
jgi:sphinganine C4-monooxygenase